MLLPMVANIIKRSLESTFYIGPFRERPQRYYTYRQVVQDYVGQTGENFSNHLYDETVLAKVNAELAAIGVEKEIEVVKPSGENGNFADLFTVNVKDLVNGQSVNIQHVGFGFSQLLPIVVQCVLAEDSTILIEQPELHLHPGMQAELGDMFIRSITSDKYPGQIVENQRANNSILIETHSEHLILRILRRIRETANDELPGTLPFIHPDDVAVLYVQPGENGSEVIEIPITEDGEFAEPWPNGFFAERAKELF